jgi:small multidrug resistance pump
MASASALSTLRGWKQEPEAGSYGNHPNGSWAFQGMHWFYLAIAIVSEVIATSALKATEGFTRWLPSLLVVVGYASAFYFLSLTLRTIPLGVSYAIWSGVGIALVSVIGWVLYDQSLDAAALVGIGLIVAGVVVLNCFSKTVPH